MPFGPTCFRSSFLCWRPSASPWYSQHNNFPWQNASGFSPLGLALYLALVTLASRLQARLTVQLGNFLFYNDGTTHQLVYSCQVARYTCDGFNYHILLKEGRSVKIPATFEKSELVMRFLEVALAAEPAHPVMASPSPLSNAR
jgi:hypothetical protein